MNQIIISTNKFKTRAAIIEDSKVVEIQIEREKEKTLSGNIYKGRVANVLPGMESAFVNIGLEKNSFLYVQDLRDFEEKYMVGTEKDEKPIEEMLNVGDDVVVQVISDPRETKGARVTTHYTIPGRYLVLMPTNRHIAVSKKITDENERERLENIFKEIVPEDMGVIIRTSAEGKSVYYFEKELQYLVKKWEDVKRGISKAKIGTILYQENSLLLKILRDVLTNEIDEIIIDNENAYWEVIDYIRAFSEGTLKTKVRLYLEKQDIFEKYGVQSEIEKALKKEVALDCGGTIVIEKTEALVSIDVNTGKNIGNQNLEDTVLNTNIEAAKEIGRQLRVRNLSGIIIIDFIDMRDEEDKEALVKSFEEVLQRDRIKNNIIHFTDLGLIEMTRKRVGKPLSYYFQEECPYCHGTGKVKSSRAIVEEIIKEIKDILDEKDIRNIKVITRRAIKEKMEEIYLDFLEALLKKHKKTIEILQFEKNVIKDYEILMER